VSLAIACVSPVRAADDAQPAHVRGAGEPRNILLLGIDELTRPYMRFLFEAFTDALATVPNPPGIFFESIDASRFPEAQYLKEARGWLAGKYKDTPIDLVVTIGDDALGFLADAHGEPWPSAQVLYFESGYIRFDVRDALPRAGGILFEEFFPSTLEVLKTILPKTKRVALSYGASPVERIRWSTYAEKIRQAHLEPVELVGLSLEETRAALLRLPPDSVVFLLSPIVDARGHVQSPMKLCEIFSTTGSNATISMEMNHLGCGTVGGLLRDWSVVGRLVGEDALRRLDKPSTAVLTVPVARFTTLAFDERQLARFGIPERRLPPGSVVHFRDPSLWRDYRGTVIAALAVTLLQSLLIAGLVFEHGRRRRAEVESRRHLSAIAHLDRRAAMGELATSLAHELNQPLNAILQNAGVAQMMLAAGPVPPALGEMSEIIGDIRKDDMRASEVIRRMRGLLQKRELEVQPVDLNEVAQETLAVVRPDARARDVELEAELADNLRPILGDRVHLQQVLLNLLMNAMDAVAAMSPERRRVKVLTMRKNGDVRLAVVDSGTGITAGRLTEIFEPFYTTKKEGSSMGMGLAIARSIVDAHSGRMGAENNPVGGATVWFSVPAAPGNEPPASALV
jgi:signal transduction histidine kinase